MKIAALWVVEVIFVFLALRVAQHVNFTRRIELWAHKYDVRKAEEMRIVQEFLQTARALGAKEVS